MKNGNKRRQIYIGQATQRIPTRNTNTQPQPVTLKTGEAWVDPGKYIGLVTVSGSVGLSGNVTLNPGPNAIGIVTVANRLDLNSNVTLDAGSLTGVRGNLTLSDSKSFIMFTSLFFDKIQYCVII